MHTSKCHLMMYDNCFKTLAINKEQYNWRNIHVNRLNFVFHRNHYAALVIHSSRRSKKTENKSVQYVGTVKVCKRKRISRIMSQKVMKRVESPLLTFDISFIVLMMLLYFIVASFEVLLLLYLNNNFHGLLWWRGRLYPIFP